MKQGQISNCLRVLCLATMCLEFWKRRQAEIAYEWDLLRCQDEEAGFCYMYNFLRDSDWLRAVHFKCNSANDTS